MAQSQTKQLESPGINDNQSLSVLLTAIAAVPEEYDRIRLIVSGIPSLLPCSLSGVGLYEEVNASWNITFQIKGQLLSENDTNSMLSELNTLFKDVLAQGSLHQIDNQKKPESAQIPQCFEELGICSLSIAPLRTIQNKLGVIFIGREKREKYFSSREIFVLQTFATHLTTTIEDYRAHKSLKKYSSDLQLKNELILNAAGEGIYGLDVKGRATFVNQSAIDILGWELRDFVGKYVHDCHHHSKPDGSPYPREDCPIYAALKDGKVHREENEVFWTKEGNAIPVEYVSTPIIEDEKIVGAVVVFNDIRKRKKAEKELRDAFKEISILKDALERERDYLSEELEVTLKFGEIVGESTALQRMLVQIEAVASTPANVLIFGESGTGKELTARAIHSRSERAQSALIKVNCASIPKELFESEFFGHVKGSFTGAHRDRVGRFELADNGTLFLDEIGEIPLDLQSKLLRVLQENEFERIGDEKTKRVDVRIVAATNRDLKKEVEAGRFREDLFYRLSVFPIEVPPLRERREDIVPLALHFLDKACKDIGRGALKLTREQGRLLENYHWPGNIRELQHVIARAVILSTGKKLQLDPALFQSETITTKKSTKAIEALPEAKFLTSEEFKQREKENIIAALQQSNWQVSGKGGAAELLDIKPTTLAHQMKKLNIKKPAKV